MNNLPVINYFFPYGIHCEMQCFFPLMYLKESYCGDALQNLCI